MTEFRVFLLLVACLSMGGMGFTIHSNTHFNMNTRKHIPRLQVAKLSEVSKELVLSTTVGGALFGLITGGLLDGLIADGHAPYLSPVSALLLGAATVYALRANDPEVNDVIIPLFGQPVYDAQLSVTNSINSYVVTTKESINNKVTGIKTDIENIPNRVKTAIKNKITGIQADILAIPDNTKIAAQNAVEDTKLAATQAIEEVKANAVQKVEDSKTAAKNKVLAIKADIVALPGRSLDAIKAKALALVIEAKKIPGKLSTTAAEYVELKKKAVLKSVDSRVAVLKATFPFSLLQSASSGTASSTKSSPVKAVPKATEIKDAKPKAEAVKAEAASATPKAAASPALASVKDAKPKAEAVKAEAAPATPKAAASPALASAAKPLAESAKPAPLGTAPAFNLFSGIGGFAASAATATPAKAKPDPVKASAVTPVAVVKVPEAKTEIAKTPIASKPKPVAATPVAEVKPKAEMKTEPTKSVEMKAAPAMAAKVVEKVELVKAKVETARPTSEATKSAPVAAPLVSSSVLSEAAIKSLSSYPATVSIQVEKALSSYVSAGGSPEAFYSEVVSSLGSKDKAFAVLPDLVGSIPRGEKKTALNAFYQNFA